MSIKNTSYFLLGAALSAFLTYGLLKPFRAFDDGIPKTYRCDQLAREADALASATAMLTELLNTSKVPVERVAADSGLQVSTYYKGAYEVFVVGNSLHTQELTFQRDADGHVRVTSFPGSVACDF